jgi:hypothetical protein
MSISNTFVGDNNSIIASYTKYLKRLEELKNSKSNITKDDILKLRDDYGINSSSLEQTS